MTFLNELITKPYLVSDRRDRKSTGKLHWICRYSKKLKCPSKITIVATTGEVTHFKEHSHRPEEGKPNVISDPCDGRTWDKTLEYSKSQQGRRILHWQGYEYIHRKSTTSSEGSEVELWGCRERVKRRCHGFLYLKNGELLGQVRCHNHIPTDLTNVAHDLDKFTGLLVYDYLMTTETNKSIGYRLKEIIGLDGSENLPPMLNLSDLAKEFTTRALLLETQRVEKEKLLSYVSPNSELKMTKSIRGGPILHYHNFEYFMCSGVKSKSGVSYWKCRHAANPACKGCQGWLAVNLSSGLVTNLKSHSHNPEAGKLESSTMGTSDSTVRYSKSKMGTPVLHYQGYEYLKNVKWHRHKSSPIVDEEKELWVCREKNKKQSFIGKRCTGYIYTVRGEVTGQVREHNHQPPKVAPIVKSDENQLVSPLFF